MTHEPESKHSFTLQHIMTIVTLIAAGSAGISGLVLWLGGKVTSPRESLQTQERALATEIRERRHADSLLNAEDTLLVKLIRGHELSNEAFRDSVMLIFRPMRINLCMRANLYEQLLMALDCDSLLRRARAAAGLHRIPKPKLPPK